MSERYQVVDNERFGGRSRHIRDGIWPLDIDLAAKRLNAQAAEIAALEAEIERLKQESTAAFRACVAVAAYYPGGINPDLDAAVQECRVIALGKGVSGERS